MGSRGINGCQTLLENHPEDLQNKTNDRKDSTNSAREAILFLDHASYFNKTSLFPAIEYLEKKTNGMSYCIINAIQIFIGFT